MNYKYDTIYDLYAEIFYLAIRVICIENPKEKQEA